MWVRACLGDVCADMSRFHGVGDVRKLRSADFFAAASRLPFYDGAVAAAMRRASERQKSAGRPVTAARLQSVEFAGVQGMAPIIEVGAAAGG